MCVEFPSRVVAVDDLGATVSREGRLRRASTILLPDVVPGDWVYVAAGAIVKRIDAREAEAIRALLLDAIAREPIEPIELVDLVDQVIPATPAGVATGGSR
ncbi:MAG TPA: HypC/HybG/HupF family hydrogenase formation chaperone [Candidatus Acidoferrales bacterium]|nr:HypC/HybG/HupF family hydrogenase formation chaperone [Candidatus Acidoferrales bacterium]